MRYKVLLKEDTDEFEMRLEYFKLMHDKEENEVRLKEIEDHCKTHRWPLVNVALDYNDALKYNTDLVDLVLLE